MIVMTKTIYAILLFSMKKIKIFLKTKYIPYRYLILFIFIVAVQVSVFHVNDYFSCSREYAIHLIMTAIKYVTIT